MGSGCICVPLVWIWWASQSSSRRLANPLDSGVTDVSGVTVPAVEMFNAVRGGGDKKEDEKQDSGLDVGNVLQTVTGDKGGEWALTTVSRGMLSFHHDNIWRTGGGRESKRQECKWSPKKMKYGRNICANQCYWHTSSLTPTKLASVMFCSVAFLQVWEIWSEDCSNRRSEENWPGSGANMI